MRYRTKLTRQTWKQVCWDLLFTHDRRIRSFAELDALALEEEEEGPSYLSDLNKVPDFVDEPPVELGEVSGIRHP